MKEGNFVRIDYILRIKESGEIFDLTDEKFAKEKGIYNPNATYSPIPVIIGAGFTIKGLEAELKKMKVGMRKKFSVKPEDAYGNRSPKLIKLIPMSEFHKRNMIPYHGMPVRINNMAGRVLSVSGGRIRVDFNHPLAGKELEYEVEMKEKITKRRDKVKAIIEIFFKPPGKDVEIVFEKKVVEIIIRIKEEITKKVKNNIATTILKWIKSLEKVRFIEEYNRSKIKTS